MENLNNTNKSSDNVESELCISDVSSSDPVIDDWTCGCLYKCNDCLKIESEGGNKRSYFERKDLDYWDE